MHTDAHSYMQITDFSTTDGIQGLSECCCAFLHVSCYCVLQNMLGQEKSLFDREAKSLHLEDLTLEKGPKLHSL